MALKAEGMWPCTVLSADYGALDDKPDITRAQIVVRIDDGPSKGQICTYEENVDHRSALYVMRSCENVGWKGGPKRDDLNTLRADVAAWILETGGKAIVEIKHIQVGTGRNAGSTWDKVKGIRRAARPLKAASGTALADAREAMRAAREAAGSESGDTPPPRGDAPPVGDEDIPF